MIQDWSKPFTCERRGFRPTVADCRRFKEREPHNCAGCEGITSEKCSADIFESDSPQKRSVKGPKASGATSTPGKKPSAPLSKSLRPDKAAGKDSQPRRESARTARTGNGQSASSSRPRAAKTARRTAPSSPKKRDMPVHGKCRLCGREDVYLAQEEVCGREVRAWTKFNTAAQELGIEPISIDEWWKDYGGPAVAENERSQLIRIYWPKPKPLEEIP